MEATWLLLVCMVACAAARLHSDPYRCTWAGYEERRRGEGEEEKRRR